jgi:hypothetical protein
MSIASVLHSAAAVPHEDSMSIRVRLTLLPRLVLAALALGALPSTSEAQFGKRLKDAVKRTAEDKAIQKARPVESSRTR